MAELKILIAGGGTGGHLFPALAIGEEIQFRQPKAKIHYIGSNFGLEAKVFPIKDVWHTLLPISGFHRGINIKSVLKNSLLPMRLIRSLYKIQKVMNEFIPQVVIGTGGYASAIPLYVASRKKEVLPIILQEQNSFPGITTRWFAKNADKICVAFDESKSTLESETIHTGNPVRKGIENGNTQEAYKQFKLNNRNKTIFLFGGSQGSSYLNKIMNQIIKYISDSGIQIIWQTGDLEYSKYKKQNSDKICVVPFINNMANAYSISDLIICRSGALTLAEITVCGKPAILIPFPFAAGDHQTKNAQSLVNAGAARILFEKSLNAQDLRYTIMNLIHNEKELKKMSVASKKLGRPDATRKIVDHIFQIIS